MSDRGFLRAILRDGSLAARAIALKQVSTAMHTNY
jgi:hypothetical protein